jgi:hypothetical protein
MGRRVVKTRAPGPGMSGCASMMHLGLTVLTCGLWGVVWGTHSAAARRKRTTKHYY